MRRLYAGYRRVGFSDLEFVLDEAFSPWAETLHEILRNLLAGEVNPDVVAPFSTGRGTVYRLRLANAEEILVRLYRHGGIFGKIWKETFLHPGRFFDELFITVTAKEAGITLLEPVGIAFQRKGVGYKGFWLCRRIPKSRSLYDWVKASSPSGRVVREVARVVAAMHMCGIAHADLTLQNILLVGAPGSKGSVSIIDFDKAKHSSPLSLRERMRQLRRLDRSLLKWAPLESRWRDPRVRLRFASEYCRHVPEIQPWVRRYIRWFGWYERWYRWGWALQGCFSDGSSTQERRRP